MQTKEYIVVSVIKLERIDGISECEIITKGVTPKYKEKKHKSQKNVYR